MSPRERIIRRDIDELRAIAEEISWETFRIAPIEEILREAGAVHVSLIERPSYSFLRFTS